MAEITSKMVQELREKTGVGMMDCKRALEEAKGDMEEAIKLLRKKGMATAEKRAEKSANEGQVASFISDDMKKGVIVELNCETDFVAKTDDFKNLLNEIGNKILSSSVKTVEEALEEKSLSDPTQKIKDRILGVIGKIGENIQLKRFEKLEGDFVSTYIHAGGKVGVILSTKVQKIDDKVKELCKDLCMQVVASSPRFVAPKNVSQEVIDSEKEIYREQILAQGKPANIVDKIVEGKMAKFYEEVCLLEQPFIKDSTGKTKVSKHISSTISEPFEVLEFKRFQVGESSSK
ncbi:MAG: translation elongation factor Ts [Acidobacteria bacterium]|nr:translation elongation factor Ts [Acidobacteriota bacterium]